MSVLSIVGRLRPEANLEQARAELQAIHQRAEQAALAADLAAPPPAAPGRGRSGAGAGQGLAMQIRVQAGPGGGRPGGGGLGGGGPGSRRMPVFDSEVRVTPLHDVLPRRVRRASRAARAHFPR
jgi:hypothetical protein